MRNNDAMKRLIKNISGQDAFIGFPRVYLRIFGTLVGAALAGQLIFWSDRGSNPWFWKSDADLADEIGITTHQRKKYVKRFTEQGWLKTEIRKANGAPTLHYLVDFEKVTNLICEFLQNGFVKIDKSLTENTPKNTPKNKNPLPGKKEPGGDTKPKTKFVTDMECLEDQFVLALTAPDMHSGMGGVSFPKSVYRDSWDVNPKMMNKLWRTPTNRFLKGVCDGDVELAGLAIFHTTLEARKKKLDIVAPNSIIPMASAMVAQKRVPGWHYDTENISPQYTDEEWAALPTGDDV